jgi:lipopolysaccharide export system protein LptA
MNFLKNIFPFLLIFYFFLPSVSSAEKTSKEKHKNLPVEITAEKMTSDQKSDHIIFIGNVVAKQGDLTISSDEMTVYNVKNKKLGKIVALGHVKMNKGDHSAESDRAEYFEKDSKIVLTGNPHAWENNNEIFGTKMIFYVDKEIFIVSGSRVIIYPEEKKKIKK